MNQDFGKRQRMGIAAGVIVIIAIVIIPIVGVAFPVIESDDPTWY
jgi:hypothetical protein